LSTPFGALTLYLFWSEVAALLPGRRALQATIGVAATYVAGRRVMQSD